MKKGNNGLSSLRWQTFCTALGSGVACLIAFWRMLGPASPNALVPQAAFDQSALDGKYVYVRTVPSRDPWSHPGLYRFLGVDVGPTKGWCCILNIGISRDNSVRSNHLSKGGNNTHGEWSTSVFPTVCISDLPRGFSPGPFPEWLRELDIVHTDEVIACVFSMYTMYNGMCETWTPSTESQQIMIDCFHSYKKLMCSPPSSRYQTNQDSTTRVSAVIQEKMSL